MKLNKSTPIIAAAVLLSGIAGLIPSASASDTTTQTVTFAVAPINELSVSGNPGTLTVSTAIAGQAPQPVSESTTSYAITTNEEGRKITGSINSPMPNGVILGIQLAAPEGASSTGKQALSPSAVDLVTGISVTNEAGLPITYELVATTAAGVVNTATKTVTLTITAGS